jgi:hypothetical protein
MTLQEIAQEMLKDIGKYAVEKEVEVPKLVQVKTHKKKRINRKWKNRYGMKVIYETKKAKVADITINDVIEFCQEKGLPLPDELLFAMQNE